MTGYIEKPKRNCLLSWLAGVLVMAEEVEKSGAVTERRQPVEGDTHTHRDTIKSEIKHPRYLPIVCLEQTKIRQWDTSALLTRLKES